MANPTGSRVAKIIERKVKKKSSADKKKRRKYRKLAEEKAKALAGENGDAEVGNAGMAAEEVGEEDDGMKRNVLDEADLRELESLRRELTEEELEKLVKLEEDLAAEEAKSMVEDKGDVWVTVVKDKDGNIIEGGDETEIPETDAGRNFKEATGSVKEDSRNV